MGFWSILTKNCSIEGFVSLSRVLSNVNQFRDAILTNERTMMRRDGSQIESLINRIISQSEAWMLKLLTNQSQGLWTFDQSEASVTINRNDRVCTLIWSPGAWGEFPTIITEWRDLSRVMFILTACQEIKEESDISDIIYYHLFPMLLSRALGLPGMVQWIQLLLTIKIHLMKCFIAWFVSRGQSNTALWLVAADHVTWTLASDWSVGLSRRIFAGFLPFPAVKLRTLSEQFTDIRVITWDSVRAKPPSGTPRNRNSKNSHQQSFSGF